MRYAAKAFFGFLACLVVFSGALFADEFRGKITQNNVLSGIIIVQLENQPKGADPEMLVNVKEKTRFEGIKGADELFVGDEIVFDATKSMFGAWSFNTLKKASFKGGKSS